jgi:predicted RNA-binding Zn-ribbon protein involved in translation (DUF1610 family)
MDDEALRHEERAIREYVLMESPKGERIKHAEKVATEHLYGSTHDIWDVRTSRHRWWVITEPTNLYSQTAFPSMDQAFTFHLGLGIRLANRNAPPVEDDEVVKIAGPWRRWQQAADALDEAEELEDFQAIGVRCREALLSMLADMTTAQTVPAGQEPPKGADFVHWTELIADEAAKGPSLADLRRYLRSSAKEAWDLVNWATHSKSITLVDTRIVVEATSHVLGVFTSAVLHTEREERRLCPKCSSVRLTQDYRPELGREHAGVTRCKACGWEDLPEDLDLSALPDRDFSRPERLEDFLDVPGDHDES